MLSNKNHNPVVTELFARGRKINIYLVFIMQSCLALPKHIRLILTPLFYYDTSKQARASANWIWLFIRYWISRVQNLACLFFTSKWKYKKTWFLYGTSNKGFLKFSSAKTTKQNKEYVWILWSSWIVICLNWKSEILG